MKNLLFILFFIFSASCTTDYDEKLGHGYIFVATNKYNHYILKDSRMIVESNVVRYKVFGEYVVGFREQPTRPDTYTDNPDGYGYFVLNLISGEIFEGIPEEEFLVKIEGIGIPEAESLTR